MTALNIITALFIMTATLGTGKRGFLLVIGIAALVLAPAAMFIVDGIDGLIFSLAGAGAAFLLSFPLAYLGLVSPADVLVSAALGGFLGAVPFVAAFSIATAFLSIQKLFKIRSSAAESLSALSPGGAGLLAFDEKSALVEIEALKILRKDAPDMSDTSFVRERLHEEALARDAAPAQILPWCAKLAIATFVVLMVGASM